MDTKHKVYVASSWRNPIQQDVVSVLREEGHDVYDFKHPGGDEHGFSWKSVTKVPVKDWTAEHFSREVLDHPVATHGFELDMTALRACSACVLVLPCGRSAHLELGYAVGHGRLTIVYMPKLEEPELMYKMVDYLETTLDGVRKQLSQDRDAPRWQADLPDGGSSEFKKRCQPYRHRTCEVCRGCWRHGTCTCGPMVAVAR